MKPQEFRARRNEPQYAKTPAWLYSRKPRISDGAIVLFGWIWWRYATGVGQNDRRAGARMTVGKLVKDGRGSKNSIKKYLRELRDCHAITVYEHQPGKPPVYDLWLEEPDPSKFDQLPIEGGPNIGPRPGPNIGPQTNKTNPSFLNSQSGLGDASVAHQILTGIYQVWGWSERMSDDRAATDLKAAQRLADRGVDPERAAAAALAMTADQWYTKQRGLGVKLLVDDWEKFDPELTNSQAGVDKELVRLEAELETLSRQWTRRDPHDQEAVNWLTVEFRRVRGEIGRLKSL